MGKLKEFGLSESLRDSFNESLSASVEYAGQLRIELLGMQEIRLHPENPRDMFISIDECINSSIEPMNIAVSTSDPYYDRKRSEIESLVPLANSIAERGLINPVLVYAEDDKYWLEAGERRTLASALAGKIHIPARIAPRKPSNLELSLVQWDENDHRLNLTLQERLISLQYAITAYCDEQNFKIEKVQPSHIQDLFRFSQSVAYNYFNVWHAWREEGSTLREAISKSNIGSIKKAAIITATKDEKLRGQLIEACKKGIGIEDLRQITKRFQVAALTTPVKARERELKTIALGSTANTKLIKHILMLLSDHSSFGNKALCDIKLDEVNWNDGREVGKIFCRAIRRLEKVV